MPASDDSTPFEVARGGHELHGEWAGDGPEIVLLHGLSATRRYVVHGSRLLERSGRRVIAYDARGHGESTPAPERTAYGYGELVADLGAVLDELGLERAVLAGNSMGAATALAFALASPERVSALVVITPGYGGRPHAAGLADWDALADGLERGGVDGFLDAYRPQVDPRWWSTVERFTRQRLERHRYPEAVADALRTVPRSAAFDGLEALERIEAPALVVGSRDDADPGHPLKLAEAHAERLPNAELVVERPGESPLAWQGAKLSRTILGFVARVEARR